MNFHLQIEMRCLEAEYQVVEFSDFDSVGNLISSGFFENNRTTSVLEHSK